MMVKREAQHSVKMHSEFKYKFCFLGRKSENWKQSENAIRQHECNLMWPMQTLENDVEKVRRRGMNCIR